jgi:hypothetical protein
VTKGPVTPTPTPRPPLNNDPIVDQVPTDDPCALPIVASFAPTAPIPIGTSIFAIPEGGRVVILTERTSIGWLPDQAAAQVRGCASRGWAYSGEVSGVAEGSIMVTLAGTRVQ